MCTIIPLRDKLAHNHRGLKVNIDKSTHILMAQMRADTIFIETCSIESFDKRIA